MPLARWSTKEWLSSLRSIAVTPRWYATFASAPEHRVEHLAQAVAERVKTEHSGDDAGHWQCHHPPGLVDVEPAFLDEAAPGGSVRGDAQSHEAQDRLDDDGDAHLEREEHEERRHQVGQNLAPENAPAVEPDSDGGGDVILLALHQHLGANDAAEARPINDDDGEDDGLQSCAHDGGEHDRK